MQPRLKMFWIPHSKMFIKCIIQNVIVYKKKEVKVEVYLLFQFCVLELTFYRKVTAVEFKIKPVKQFS